MSLAIASSSSQQQPTQQQQQQQQQQLISIKLLDDPYKKKNPSRLVEQGTFVSENH
jgi:hypothetical protein